MIISGGEALVDLVPHPVVGGGPFNVAVAAARLGGAAAFVGPVSTDAYGDQIMAHLLDNGVDVTLCPRLEAPTARAIIEHTPKLVFRFEGTDTADTLLAEADLSVFGEGPHILHGGTLGLFRGKTAETLASAAEEHDGLVSLDPNIRPQIISDRAGWDHFHQRWLAGTDIYKGSDEDFDWVWPGRGTDSVTEELLANGVTAVILTRGGEGLSVATRDGQLFAQAPAVEVVDTVGAGDTIVAALLVSLAEHGVATGESLAEVTGGDWQIMADRAVAAAAITVSRAGADTPRRDELPW
ncbi:MAG: PfkB family carbohydrate kinase [Actinomycetota bacterium]